MDRRGFSASIWENSAAVRIQSHHIQCPSSLYLRIFMCVKRCSRVRMQIYKVPNEKLNTHINLYLFFHMYIFTIHYIVVR